jgi:hypothetical protein
MEHYDEIEDFEISVVETMTTTGARIKAIGVGGGVEI